MKTKLEEKLEEWVEKNHLPILEENEKLKEQVKNLERDVKRYREQAQRLYKKAKLREVGVEPEPEEVKKMYAVYDNDTDMLIVVGTSQECADALNIKLQTFQAECSPSRMGKRKKYKVVKVRG